MYHKHQILFLAFALIDGPNIIEKLTGVDAGLKSGFGKLAAAYTIAKTGGELTDRMLFGGGRDQAGHRTGGLLNNERARSYRQAGMEMANAAIRALGAGIGAGVGNMVGDLENQMKQKTGSDAGNSNDEMKRKTGSDAGRNDNGANGNYDTNGNDRQKMSEKADQNKQKVTSSSPSDKNGSNSREINSAQGDRKKTGTEENLDEKNNNPLLKQEPDQEKNMADRQIEDVSQNTTGSNMFKDIMGDEWNEGKERMQKALEPIHRRKNPISTGYRKAYERTVGEWDEDNHRSVKEEESNHES